MAFAISFLSRLNKSISICVSLFSTPELLQSGHTVPTEHIARDILWNATDYKIAKLWLIFNQLRTVGLTYWPQF